MLCATRKQTMVMTITEKFIAHYFQSSMDQHNPSHSKTKQRDRIADTVSGGGCVMYGGWNEWVRDSLERLDAQKILRTHRTLLATDSPVKAHVTAETFNAWINESTNHKPEFEFSRGVDMRGVHNITMFSTNDYLGLSMHPDVQRAASECVLKYGMGPRSSALVSGYTHMHRELETGLAELKESEECLLFPTGYAANLAVISALAGAQDVAIFSDELNHASIVDGCKLATKSNAALNVYRHNDLQHLDWLLEASTTHRRKLVVSDSLFSMDGDFADLRGLVELRRKHDFLLVVDEAHATLVSGESGGGACQQQGVAHQVDVHIGTMSKGIGALGGFVCCTRQMRQLLATKGRTHVFSTSLPLPVVAGAQEAIRISWREGWRRRHLWDLVEFLGRELRVPAMSPIVPLVVGGEDDVMRFGKSLLQQGMHVGAIRPPTVPKGTSRLRISLSAAHSFQDVRSLVNTVQNSGHQYKALQDISAPQSRL